MVAAVPHHEECVLNLLHPRQLQITRLHWSEGISYARISNPHNKSCSKVLKPPTHASMRTHRQSKVKHQHSQDCLPSHLRILFWIFLSTKSRNSCSGACTNAHLPAQSHLNPVSHGSCPHTVTFSSNLFQQLDLRPTTQPACNCPQRTRRNLECSSETP